MQRRKLNDLKMQVRILGGEIDEGDGGETSDKEKAAKEKLADPLKDFPNDIENFNEKKCRDKIAVSNRFGDRIAEEQRWNQFRMEACLGKHGPVAKRSSMNDVLWGRYLKHRDQLTLEDVKRMILFDVKRRELYPPGYKGTGEEPPPEEYLKQLQNEERLDQIYKELDALSVRKDA